jgi:CyaY protein
MDDRTYSGLVDLAFEHITKALDAMDPDDVELDSGGGYLTLTFRDQSKCVISTQRPVQEIWMAADNTAWHFSAPGGDGRWVANKTQQELFSTVSGLVGKKTGKPFSL